MSPRPRSSIPCALALGFLLVAPCGQAATSDPLDSPLARALQRRAAAGGAAASLGAFRSGPAAFGTDPFHGLVTAFPALTGTVTRVQMDATRAVPKPASTGGGAGKLPGGEGIAGDGYGTSVTPAGDMHGDGVSDVAVGAPFAVGPNGMTGRVDLVYGSPISPSFVSLYGEALNDGFGYSVAGVGDVNGDGYPDLLVGAPFHASGGNANSGRAYLFLGSASGIQTIPAWSFATNEVGADVGLSVAWAGDVNGDGYDDWIVGAPGHTNGETSEGAVYLFYGGPGPLSTTPVWSYEPNQAFASLGQSVATAGDVNGDGFADLVIGAPAYTNTFSQEGRVLLFLGHNSLPSLVPDRTWDGGQLGAHLGTSVATAGDVNGDGYADFLAGAPQFDDAFSNQGEVLVFQGAPLPVLIGAPEQIEAGQGGASFGQAVGTAGDVNGDGYADIIVGAPGIPNAPSQGGAFVYVGTSLGVIPFVYESLSSTVSGSIVGVSVGTMGNFFNDGYSDYWTGVPAPTTGDVKFNEGHVYSPGNTEQLASQGLTNGAEYGRALAAADVNGDGYDDLIVGSYVAGDNQPYDGKLSLYLGGRLPFQPAGPFPFIAPAPDWTYEGDNGDFLGVSIQNAGDVNGDGYQDFIAGAPFHSTAATLGAGEALLFYGSPAGPQGGSPWKVEGTNLAGFGGYSVSGSGDLNGDGYDDVVVGFPQDSVQAASEGQVKVFFGSKFGLSHVPAVSIRGRRENADLGTGATIVGDINGDGYDDLVIGAPYDSVTASQEGVAFVHYGSPTGPHAQPDDSIAVGVAQANFGFSVFRIGDVNADGYDDVCIAAPNLSDAQTNQGKLFVFLGSATGLQRPATFTWEGDNANAQLGLWGVSGGDLNADGYSDLLVGEPYSDIGATQGGRVMVFNGFQFGVVGVVGFDEHGAQANLNLGYATVARADYDGDGFADMAYTTPGSALAATDEGGALVRFGNDIYPGFENQDRPLWAWRADDTAPISPGLRSESNTSFRLRARVRSAAGRTRVRLDTEVKALATPFDGFGRVGSPYQSTGPVLAGRGSASTLNALVSGLSAGTRYHWRGRFATRSPFFPYSPWFSTEQRGSTERQIVTAGGPGPVGVDPLPHALGDVALAPAAPNPSAALASLVFSLPRSGRATLALYDVRGRLVRTLFDTTAPAGETRVAWDGRDELGAGAPAGVYFAHLTALGAERTERLVHVR